MKFCYLAPLSKKMKRWIDVFFIGFLSVGTDGARTRSFRLDRAVLWPIELQSQGNKAKRIAYIFLWFHSNPFYLYFRFELLCWNRDASDILIFTRICTLVKLARITNNPFITLVQNGLILNFSLKNWAFPLLFFLDCNTYKILRWI